MNGIIEFLHRLFRAIIRIVLIAGAAVFLLSLLLATLAVMLVVTVWAVVTGRKPDPARIFGQFRATSARYTRGAWSTGAGPGAGTPSRPADIVDVVAHEVRETPHDTTDGARRAHRPGNDPMARMSNSV